MTINNNIEESYCSKEVHTLLKLKGFEVTAWNVLPTHGLAIEWIRINHNVWIYPQLYVNSFKQQYIPMIVPSLSINPNNTIQLDCINDSPQEATEAGLLYTLTNLIK